MIRLFQIKLGLGRTTGGENAIPELHICGTSGFPSDLLCNQSSLWYTYKQSGYQTKVNNCILRFSQFCALRKTDIHHLTAERLSMHFDLAKIYKDLSNLKSKQEQLLYSPNRRRTYLWQRVS